MDFSTFDVDTRKADLSTVSGTDNLAQAIILRLMTPVGTRPLRPTFGSQLPLMLGKGQSAEMQRVAQMIIGSTVLQEPRVLGVEDIQVEFSDDRMQVSFVALGVNLLETTQIDFSMRV